MLHQQATGIFLHDCVQLLVGSGQRIKRHGNEIGIRITCRFSKCEDMEEYFGR